MPLSHKLCVVRHLTTYKHKHQNNHRHPGLIISNGGPTVFMKERTKLLILQFHEIIGLKLCAFGVQVSQSINCDDSKSAQDISQVTLNYYRYTIY